MNFVIPEDPVLIYHGLMRVWDDQTAFLSVGHERHPAFNRILAMKYEIPLVQLALDDLRKHPWHSMSVLWAIVDQPPIVPEEIRGRLGPLTALWRQWGKEHGYGGR